MDDEDLINELIRTGEAVEYGERWTEHTTHEWWWCANNKNGRHRHVRLVATHHGGGNRGDDDEAEYVQRLLTLGRAVLAADATYDLGSLPIEFTHVIRTDAAGKRYAERFRQYQLPPEGIEGSSDGTA